MRVNGRIVFCLVLMAVAVYAIIRASQWSFNVAFFPMAVSIPLLALTTAQLLIELLARDPKKSGGSHDLDLASDVPPEVAKRRTITIFAWIGGFLLLIYLIGFPYAVPVFVFAYLAPQEGVNWWLKALLTLAVWGFFYFLFVRMLHLPFDTLRILTWLGL